MVVFVYRNIYGITAIVWAESVDLTEVTFNGVGPRRIDSVRKFGSVVQALSIYYTGSPPPNFATIIKIVLISKN